MLSYHRHVIQATGKGDASTLETDADGSQATAAQQDAEEAVNPFEVMGLFNNAKVTSFPFSPRIQTACPHINSFSCSHMQDYSSCAVQLSIAACMVWHAQLQGVSLCSLSTHPCVETHLLKKGSIFKSSNNIIVTCRQYLLLPPAARIGVAAADAASAKRWQVSDSGQD